VDVDLAREEPMSGLALFNTSFRQTFGAIDGAGIAMRSCFIALTAVAAVCLCAGTASAKTKKQCQADVAACVNACPHTNGTFAQNCRGRCQTGYLQCMCFADNSPAFSINPYCKKLYAKNPAAAPPPDPPRPDPRTGGPLGTGILDPGPASTPTGPAPTGNLLGGAPAASPSLK
jgi:hypothetical protein